MNTKKQLFNYQMFVSLLFLMLIALLLYPIFAFDYILTHDGPAHVYNASLIGRLLSPADISKDFLIIKRFPEPNWLGHFILLLLQRVFSPRISEKIFLGSYVVLLPVFFKILLTKVNFANRQNFLLMIFPFVYSYFFIGGLYNFISGVVVLFAALALILPELERPRKWTNLKIVFFSMLLYFSHLIVLGIFLLMILIAHVFIFNKNRAPENASDQKLFIRRASLTFVSLLPSLIFLFIFLFEKFRMKSTGGGVSFDEMIHALIYISPVVTLQENPESMYAGILLVLFIIVFAVLAIPYFKSHKVRTTFYESPSYWLICSMLMLILFFIFPDHAASGGVIKFRFEYFFFLFLIVFFTTLPSKKLLVIFVSLTITIWIIAKNIYMFPKMSELNTDVIRLMKCMEVIKDESIVLPLNYSLNWMHCNILNYVGAEKPVLVLDNYEAGVEHFPLKWKDGMNPVNILGNFNIEPPPLCADVNAFEIQTGKLIDYILVYRYQELADSCSVAIRATLSKNYVLVYKDEDAVQLFRRKLNIN